MVSARAAEKAGWWRFYQLPVAVASKRQAWISASVKSTEVAKSPSVARGGPTHRWSIGRTRNVPQNF
jgi:hypothetical protein